MNDEVSNINIYPQYLKMRRGETHILETSVLPENANTQGLIWECDNNNIAIIHPSINGRRCEVIASQKFEGKGNIRCRSVSTGASSICNIEVVTEFSKNIIGSIALILFGIGFIIPFLLPISALLGIIGLIVDKEPSHRERNIQCLVGSLIVLFIWISLYNFICN